ncbi:hypothetical protein LX36DRAFT_732417 [Colletotrichum falcatum]|nr:hypothetical protein LX36DRAFT_732417 [Colletotrichum falcatum]
MASPDQLNFVDSPKSWWTVPRLVHSAKCGSTANPNRCVSLTMSSKARIEDPWSKKRLRKYQRTAESSTNSRPSEKAFFNSSTDSVHGDSSRQIGSLIVHVKDRHSFNERAPLESYIEHGEEDLLNREAQNACQLPNLARLELHVSWILSAAALSGIQLRSSLESLLVDLAATTPDGRWHLNEMDLDPLDTDSEHYDDYHLEREPKELPDIDSENSDQEDPELPEKAVEVANLDSPTIQIRGILGPDTLVPLVSSFAEAVGKAETIPGSSLRGLKEKRRLPQRRKPSASVTWLSPAANLG